MWRGSHRYGVRGILWLLGIYITYITDRKGTTDMKNRSTGEDMDWGELADWCRKATTVRKLCDTLQVGRRWISKYILSQIIDGNTDTGDYVKIGPKWAPKMQRYIGGDSPECVFLRKSRVIDVLTSGIISVDVRTIVVSEDRFWKSTAAKNRFQRDEDRLLHQLDDQRRKWLDGELSDDEMKTCERRIMETIENLRWEAYSDTAKKMLRENRKMLNGTKRGDSPWYGLSDQTEYGKQLLRDVIENGNPRHYRENKIPRKLQNVPDLKGWGDTDEMAYRALFAAGRARLTLQLPDINGVLGKNVYYIENPINEHDNPGPLLSYKVWMKYRDQLNTKY